MGKLHYKSPFSISTLNYQRVVFMVYETRNIIGGAPKKVEGSSSSVP
jgi:hypothetical protein